MDNIKVLSLFSGVGTDNFALKRLGLPFECIGFSDIDKYANKFFRQNHWTTKTKSPGLVEVITSKELGDVKLINPNELEDFDLLTAGFPCQSFSSAGNGLGEKDQRGNLFQEIIRIAEIKKPRWMILENVKGLTTKKHIGTFNKILVELKRIGYLVHWAVLNTKDYGIPQDRKRLWILCFRDKEDYDTFSWPKKIKMKSINKILEPLKSIDKKLYLSNEQIDKLNLKDLNNKSSTVILRGRPKMPYEPGKRKLFYKEYLYCPTLTQTCASGDQKNIVWYKKKGIFRKLSPLECFRLHGFLDSEINLTGIPNPQLYKLAGNGQSINILSLLIKEIVLR